MANFEARTASSGARIQTDKEQDVDALLARYNFSSELIVAVERGVLYVYGYDWLYAERVLEGDDDLDQENCFDDFLKELAPMLSEPLLIQSIGAEKCRFPMAAVEVLVKPSGELVWAGFDLQIEAKKDENS